MHECTNARLEECVDGRLNQSWLMLTVTNLLIFLGFVSDTSLVQAEPGSFYCPGGTRRYQCRWAMLELRSRFEYYHWFLLEKSPHCLDTDHKESCREYSSSGTDVFGNIDATPCECIFGWEPTGPGETKEKCKPPPPGQDHLFQVSVGRVLSRAAHGSTGKPGQGSVQSEVSKLSHEIDDLFKGDILHITNKPSSPSQPWSPLRYYSQFCKYSWGAWSLGSDACSQVSDVQTSAHQFNISQASEQRSQFLSGPRHL